jgi:hypothetical protein
MAREEIEGIVRRVDIANGMVTLVSGGLRTVVIPFDLDPFTPDYRTYIGADVRVVMEDGKLTEMVPVT